jgi:hypothetical protein
LTTFLCTLHIYFCRILISKLYLMILIPSQNETLLFTPICKRIKTSPNSKNKSGYNYTMQIDSKLTKSNLLTLINKIPNQPGYLILFASKDNINFKPIKKFHSNYNLRQQFFQNSNILTIYNYLINTITLNNYKSIKIQLYKPK